MPAIARELFGPPNYPDTETIEQNMNEESAEDKVFADRRPAIRDALSLPRSLLCRAGRAASATRPAISSRSRVATSMCGPKSIRSILSYAWPPRLPT